MTIKAEIMLTPDTEAIAAIHQACFPKGWNAGAIAELLAVEGTKAFGAEGGFALIRLMAGEAELLTICVLPAYRHKGIGDALVGTFCDWLLAQGARSVFLEVNEHNESALRLYGRHNFSIIARRREYYQNGDGSHEHALIMRLDLEEMQ